MSVKFEIINSGTCSLNHNEGKKKVRNKKWLNAYRKPIFYVNKFVLMNNTSWMKAK